jgi:transposase
MDTEFGCFIKPEVGHAEKKIRSGLKVEAVKLVRDRGVSAAQAARDLGVHENVLRKWVKEFGSDPVQAFPGHGQMKPEQQEIERLRREVHKLKAGRPQPSSRRKRHEIRVHREAPECLAGGVAMQCIGDVPVGLPRLAESISQRQIPQ